MKTERFQSGKEEIKDLYIKYRDHFSPAKQVVMDAIISSNSWEEVYQKVGNDIKKNTIWTYYEKVKIELKSGSPLLEQKRNNDQYINLNDQQLLDLYYVYEPYIPLPDQKKFIEILEQKDRKSCNGYSCYLNVVNFLKKCDIATRNGQPLPSYTKKRQIVLKKEAVIHALDSVLPNTIEKLLKKYSSIPHQARQFLILYYGIGCHRHTISEIQKKYPSFSEHTILQQIYYSLKRLKKLEKEQQSQLSELERHVQQVKEKFAFNQYVLTPPERRIVDEYYGITKPKKTIAKLAQEQHLSISKTKELLQHGTYLVVHSDALSEGPIADSFTALRDDQEEVKESDLRPLRLIVQQILDENGKEISASQYTVLNLFYGFQTTKVMSISEISEYYQVPIQDMYLYIKETIRYLLNFISKEQVVENSENSKTDKQIRLRTQPNQ